MIVSAFSHHVSPLESNVTIWQITFYHTNMTVDPIKRIYLGFSFRSMMLMLMLSLLVKSGNWIKYVMCAIVFLTYSQECT